MFTTELLENREKETKRRLQAQHLRVITVNILVVLP